MVDRLICSSLEPVSQSPTVEDLNSFTGNLDSRSKVGPIRVACFSGANF